MEQWRLHDVTRLCLYVSEWTVSLEGCECQWIYKTSVLVSLRLVPLMFVFISHHWIFRFIRYLHIHRIGCVRMISKVYIVKSFIVWENKSVRKIIIITIQIGIGFYGELNHLSQTSWTAARYYSADSVLMREIASIHSNHCLLSTMTQFNFVIFDVFLENLNMNYFHYARVL